MRNHAFRASLAVITLGPLLLPAPAEEITYVARLGLFDGSGQSVYTSEYGQQDSSFQRLTESGWISGHSRRYNGSNREMGSAAWVANAWTGVTTRVGFFSGAEFTTPGGYQTSDISSSQVTESGWLSGTSARWNGYNYRGNAAWVANAQDGSTHRIGLISGPEFTRHDGFQKSTPYHLTESGWVSGFSERFGTTGDRGYAAWVAKASDGTTSRVGLYSGSEFANSIGTQDSRVERLTESGWVSGSSLRYSGGGEAAWIARAADGISTRVGFFSHSEFTRDDGAQETRVKDLSNSGWVTGYSKIYNGKPDPEGYAAWVANGADGITTRIGLLSGPEFVRSDGSQSSSPSQVTDSGWVSGTSGRLGGGSATWVVNASTGSTTRVGLFSGPEFTRASGYQDSELFVLTESGWLSGTSERFNGTSFNGKAAWVANAATGATTRIGLFSGAEFTSNVGSQTSRISHVSESGWLSGSSSLYNGSANYLGEAVWVANASDGSTSRIGLFTDSEFTHAQSGAQSSTVLRLTESGWVSGTSRRLSTNSRSLNQAVWVAAAANGTTTRVGLFGSPSYTAVDGGEESSLRGLSEEGLAWGSSVRFSGDNIPAGETGWIYDGTTGNQVTFELAVRASDGYAFSSVSGITRHGLAYGYYKLFSDEMESIRWFIWSSSLGTHILDDAIGGGIAQYGWEQIQMVRGANSEGFLVGTARPLGSSESGGVGLFLIQVPEPTTAAFLILGTPFLGIYRRRSSKRAA